MEEEKPYAPKSGLTMGMGNLETKSDSSVGFSGFSFKPTSSAATGSGFSFLGGSSGPSSLAPTSGFSFAVGTSKPSGSGGEGERKEEDDYVPPIVETVEHKEEGSLYSKK